MNQVIGRYACMFCMFEESMEVRLDKKGRPYLTCGRCSTRAFFHSELALKCLKEFLGINFTFADYARMHGAKEAPVPVRAKAQGA